MAKPLQQYIGYKNLVTIYNVAAGSELSGFPVTNLANPATNSKWKSDSTSVQYITITLGGLDVDYIGIAGHNLGSAGSSVVIEGQESSGGAWGTVVASFSPADDLPIMKIFTSGEFYAIRLKITPASTKPQIAVLYAGEVTQLERNTYIGKSPITYARNVSAVNGFSESGAYLGRIIRGTTYSATISMQNVTPAWYRGVFDLFAQEAETTPFFYSWRYTDYPLEIGYAVISGSVPIPKNSGPGARMSVEFDIEGVA